jgi:hypothetical protein
MSREIIKIDNALQRRRGRWISSDVGTYRDVVTMALAIKRAGKITTVLDITRAQYGRLTDVMEEYARSRVWKAVNLLLEDGIVAYPIYDELGHHKVIGIKVITEYSKQDIDALTKYQDQAEQRGDIAKDKVKLLKRAVAKLRKQLPKTSTNGE